MKLGPKNGVGIQFGAGLSGYIADLIPAMLTTFLDGDRAFNQTRAAAGRTAK